MVIVSCMYEFTPWVVVAEIGNVTSGQKALSAACMRSTRHLTLTPEVRARKCADESSKEIFFLGYHESHVIVSIEDLINSVELHRTMF